MADEKPMIPPLRLPVSEFRAPSPAVVFFTELVSRTDLAYQQNAPVARGTLYSTIIGGNQTVAATYPSLYFVAERKFQQSDTLVFWDWATVPDAENTYNSEVKYVANAVAYPSFTRVYTLRRDDYEATPTLAIGSTLTALIGVTIEDRGQGYTYATGTIEGKDVAINFVVVDGVIVSGVITSEGTNVLATDTIVITGDGIGAVATPIVQPTTCYLTSQVKQEMIQANPFRDETQDNLRNEFVRVIRIYTTLPGPILTKTTIDANGDIMTETRQMVIASTLVTSNVIAAGVWTKTFEEPDENLFTAFKVIQVRNTQNSIDSYEVSIPDLIPQEFRATLPVTTHESTVIGTASLPTLAVGDLSRRQAQLDDYTYRLTISGRAGITLPQVITNKETTSQFGGGDVNVTLTLDLFNNLTLDEGLMVLVPSEIKKLDSQANGLAVKTSRIVIGTAWPILHGTHVDEKYDLTIGIQRQTVAAGTTGGVLGDGTIVEVRPHDKWKSIKISSKLDVDTLPEDVQWFGAMRHSFPPELTDAVIDWAFAECGCSFSFSAVLIANLNQYSGMVKTRVTEQFYNGPPPDDQAITQFFPQTHHFGFAWASACGSTDGSCRTKSGAPEFHVPLCLHDDLSLSVGVNVWNFAATSPAALPHSTYIMLAPHVERWRFGVFRRVLTEVLVP